VTWLRLDKFLKLSRLIKRRTVAKELCSQGWVEINGRTAKPGNNVKIGDIITLHMGDKTVRVKVKKLLQNVKKNEAPTMYEIV